MTPCTGNKQDMINAGAKIGKNVSIIGDIHFSSEPYLISVGDNTTISFECALITHDAATRVIRNMPNQDPRTVIYGPIKIGSNCFIGARTTILPGVKIGDNTIIGSCSLVNKDIPSNVVAAGNPCKVICTIDEYIDKHKDDFLYIVNLPSEEKKDVLLKLFNIS